MELEKRNQLSKQQISEVKELVNTCLEADGLKRELYLKNDLNLYENLDSFYLLYDEGKLVSVLTILQINEKEVEISGYTIPDQRNKGYFATLLDAAEDELIAFDLCRVNFVIEPTSTHGKMAVMSFGASYVRSEYLLTLNLEEYSKRFSLYLFDLNMKVSTLSSMDRIQAAYTHSEIFETEFEKSEEMMEHVLESKQMVCYCAKVEDELIGTCNVNYNKDKAFIFGYGILPGYQGKGYGKAFIHYVLQQLIKEGIKKVSLQVNSDSEKAMGIYHYLGFDIITQYDYYAYEIEFEE